MEDRRNGVIHRTAFVASYPAGTTCPIAAGEQGLWANAGVLTYRRTDGHDVILDNGVFGGELAIARGVIPAARCAFSAQPANNDTLTIGGSSFTFKTTLIAATTTTQVMRGASAAATLASLLNAINGVTDATVVPNTTPFVLAIVADAVTATVLRIRKALTQGGTAISGTMASTVLAASISGGASAWSQTNLNETGKGGADVQMSAGSVTISADMVTNGSLQIELPFTPTIPFVYARSSTGVLRSVNEAVTISGNALSIVLAGGASPNFQAGDLVSFIAWA